jgi:hypothetical protein
MMVASALDPLTDVANRGKMRLAKKLLVAVCLSLALLVAAKGAAAQGLPLRDQISDRENKLAQARAKARTQEKCPGNCFFLARCTGCQERCKKRWSA